ncbi:MAG TPA: class I SAM-dependent methyltransferase [Myxococcales bacterium]|nr:class I SAM-dependent methyltransferase [Myxococcales bacterium]
MIEAQVIRARPNTLVVAFKPGEQPPASGAPFREAALDLGGRWVELGRCRFEASDNVPRRRKEDPPPESATGRLVFQDRIYDFSGLLGRRAISDLQQRVNHLPMAWNRRHAISNEFRAFVADLLFDLQVYRSVFEDLDARLAGESEQTRRELQTLAREQEYPRFRTWLDERVAELERITSSLARPQQEQHGFYFRKQMRDFILSSELLSRTNSKPRGYAGDSDVMRLLYANDFRGPTVFAQFMHKYPAELAAAQAVRNRRRLVSEWVRERIVKRTPEKPLRVLSVACGPAEELGDVLLTPDDVGRVQFMLLDQDPEALGQAHGVIEALEKKLGTRPRAETLCTSVRTMQQGGSPIDDAVYDFVYSMGLFDYLTDTTATAVLTWLYGRLAPGGELVVGNFHSRNPSRVFMEYWADWTLWYRNEGELLRLADALPGAQSRVTFEESGCQIFLHITRSPGRSR